MSGDPDRRLAVLSAPYRLNVTESAVPVEPAADELLVAPDAVGICGTDIELFHGSMAYLQQGLATYPIVPGHEWTGLVLGVGSRVAGFDVGDRVVGECTVSCGRCDRCRAGTAYHLCPARTETGIMRRDGGLATRLVFPARAAHRVPPHVDPRDAVLVEPLAVAYRGVHRLLDAGDRSMVVVGAGAIGILAALVARAAGVERIRLVDPDEHRRAFAVTLGFDASDRVDERSPRVVEASGTADGLRASMRLAAEGGKVLVLGLTGAASVAVDVDDVVLRDLTVLGSLGSPAVWPQAIELVASGAIAPGRLVSHEYGLDDVKAAYEQVADRRPGTRKVLVRPQQVVTGQSVVG